MVVFGLRDMRPRSISGLRSGSAHGSEAWSWERDQQVLEREWKPLRLRL